MPENPEAVHGKLGTNIVCYLKKEQSHFIKNQLNSRSHLGSRSSRLFGFLCVVCVCPDRDSGDHLLLFFVVVLTAQFRRSLLEPMIVRGQMDFNQKRKGFKAGPVRKDKLSAKAVVIAGLKKWYCRFCPETNVWSRAKCRSCKTDIPSGLHGKHLQAAYTRNGRSWWASSSPGDGEHLKSKRKNQQCSYWRQVRTYAG